MSADETSPPGPRADGKARKHQRHPCGAQPFRRVFGDERNRIRHYAAHAETGDKTQQHEFVQRSRPHRQKRQQTEKQTARHDRTLAAEAVAEIAEDERAEQRAEQTRAEDWSKAAARHVPLLDDGGRSERHGRLIVTVHQHDEKAPEQQADRETSWLLLFDECRYVECALCLHVRPNMPIRRWRAIAAHSASFCFPLAPAPGASIYGPAAGDRIKKSR